MRLVLTDISAHRAAEESLQITAAKSKALLSAIPDLIFTNHRNGKYLAVEASNPGLLFVPPEAFLHRTVAEVLPQPIAQRFLATCAQALDSRCMQEVNYSLPIGADEMHFEARVVPLTSDTAVTILRDITGR